MSETIHTLGERLKEERQRLGYSQESFAALAGVTRIPYREWEKGATSPTAIHLAALSQAGADVLYIVTGKRDAATLTPDEAALLDNYRHSPEAGRRAIRGAAHASAQPDEEMKAAANRFASLKESTA